jgi:hypothetical protein
VDTRDPNSPNLDFTVKLRFDTNSGNVVNLGYARRNVLSFVYPVESMKDASSNTKRFGGKTPTFWVTGVDSPILDVDKIIKTNNGVFELLATQWTYPAKFDYFVGTVSFNRPVCDVVRNGKVDAEDYNFVKSKLGFAGPTSADVWGSLGLGMPDGRVDSNDVEAVFEVLSPEEKAKVIPPKDLAEKKSNNVGFLYEGLSRFDTHRVIYLEDSFSRHAKTLAIPSWAQDQAREILNMSGPIYRDEKSIVRV